jgi:DNA modification methylase
VRPPWALLDSPVLCGECIETMRTLGDCSIDAVVTDPPYGIGFMGHEWDQPREYGAVRSMGTPGVFASGRADPGRSGVPSGQRRDRQPAPSGFTKKLGARAINRDRGGAMEAGRYDLSLTANRLFQQWCEAWGTEALRVLKPGGHMLVSGSPRTYHRLAAGLEDAGLEIRDSLMWLYGSGFPKSRNLDGDWEGWGTALKPGHEPIVVARKPLDGTVATNVLAHGTGGLNIDATRLNAEGEDLGRWPADVVFSHSDDCVLVGERQVASNGHFPAARGASGYGSNGPNVEASTGGGLKGQHDLDERHFAGESVEVWACVPGCPVRALDDQSGELTSGANPTLRNSDKFGGIYGDFVGQREIAPARGVDRGGASRFFYCAKASRAERNAGLEGFEKEPLLWSNGEQNPGSFQGDGTERAARNHHPTVKPVALMRWMIRLVTPPGGVVLDMFAGSGTTLCAGAQEGVAVIGIERDLRYVQIARARHAWWAAHPEGVPIEKGLASSAQRQAAHARGEMSLFDA